MFSSEIANLATTVCVTIAGIIGIKIALHGRTDQRARKHWYYTIGLSMAIFIFALSSFYNSARNRNEAEEKERARDENMRQLGQDIRELMAFVSRPQIPADPIASQTVQPRERPRQSDEDELLRDRTLALAREINQFVANNEPTRAAGNQKAPIIGGNHSGVLAAMLKSSLQDYRTFMSSYSAKFSARVIEIHDQFARKGIRDSTLEKLYRDPTNPAGVRIVAERFRQLADRQE